MKRLWILGLLVTVAACSTKPTPPVTVQPPPPPHAAPKSAEARLYNDEAAALKAYPKFARRDGNKLILSYDGRDVVRLTSTPESACEGWETCSLWSFAGLVTLHGGPVIVVRREQGEGENHILFDRSGKAQWLIGAPVVSPDGQHVAAGETATMLSDGFSQIVDWRASPREVFDSEAPCQPVKWTSPTRLAMSCNRDPEGAAPPTDALAEWKGGQWHVTSAQPLPPFKLRPTLTAAEQAQSRTWDKNVGIEVVAQ